MTTRRIRREDPAYLLAMREAKVLFDAEMAKSAMKGRGRPKTVVVAAAPVADVADDVDLSDVALEIVSEVEAEGVEAVETEQEEPDEEIIEDEEEEEEAEIVAAPAKKTAKTAAKAPAKKAAKKAAAPAKKAPAGKPAKPAAKKR